MWTTPPPGCCPTMAPAENDASFRKQIASIRAALLPENFALFRKKVVAAPLRSQCESSIETSNHCKGQARFPANLRMCVRSRMECVACSIGGKSDFQNTAFGKHRQAAAKAGPNALSNSPLSAPSDRVIGGGVALSPQEAPFPEKIAGFCKKTGRRY